MKDTGPFRLTRKRRNLAAIPLGIAFALALNVLFETLPRSWGLDVTASGQHTLSEATRATLAGIPETLTLRLYISPAIEESRGQRRQHAERVLDLLRRYERLAEGKIDLRILRPEPFSETEDQALADGLRPLRLGPDGQTGYFGLAGFNTTDDRETIAYFDPDRAGLLESDLTRRLHSLAYPRKPLIGLMGQLDLKVAGSSTPNSAQPNRLRTAIDQQFEIRPLDMQVAAIPKELDALMLVQPTGLAPETRNAIRQYRENGGHVLAFVDPLSEYLRYRRTPKPGARPGDALTALLADWGVRLTQAQFVGDRRQALSVRARVGNRDTDIDYVGWLGLNTRSLADDEAVTAGLGRLVMKSAGALQLIPDRPTPFIPLVESSPESALLSVDKIADGPRPAALLSGFPKGGNLAKRTLAARLPSDNNDIGQVILVADSDLLHDAAWLQGQSGDAGKQKPVADNGTFVLNALESLTGSRQLAGLTGGTPPDRPFTRIEALRQDAEQRYRARERDLIATVRDARQELGNLRRQQTKRGTAPTDAEKARMAELREKLSTARRKLRNVQHKLHQDITRLKSRIRLANIWGVPALVILGVCAFTLRRWQRRQKRAGTWASLS